MKAVVIVVTLVTSGCTLNVCPEPARCPSLDCPNGAAPALKAEPPPWRWEDHVPK